MKAVDRSLNGTGDGTISKSSWKDLDPSHILTLNAAQSRYSLCSKPVKSWSLVLVVLDVNF